MTVSDGPGTVVASLAVNGRVTEVFWIDGRFRVQGETAPVGRVLAWEGAGLLEWVSEDEHRWFLNLADSSRQVLRAPETRASDRSSSTPGSVSGDSVQTAPDSPPTRLSRSTVMRACVVVGVLASVTACRLNAIPPPQAVGSNLPVSVWFALAALGQTLFVVGPLLLFVGLIGSVGGLVKRVASGGPVTSPSLAKAAAALVIVAALSMCVGLLIGQGVYGLVSCLALLSFLSVLGARRLLSAVLLAILAILLVARSVAFAPQTSAPDWGGVIGFVVLAPFMVCQLAMAVWGANAFMAHRPAAAS
jgi:hypothetical protein